MSYTVWETAFIHYPMMGDELLPKHSPNKYQKLVMINGIHHVLYNDNIHCLCLEIKSRFCRYCKPAARCNSNKLHTKTLIFKHSPAKLKRIAHDYHSYPWNDHITRLMHNFDDTWIKFDAQILMTLDQKHITHTPNLFFLTQFDWRCFARW